MKITLSKIFIMLFVGLSLFFFTNDFGLIDIERTAIVTAIGIDKEQDEYTVSAEVAVPEATDTNAENQKALLSGSGKTVAGAIKDLGDHSGWFPKLSFCNLIIMGKGFDKENVITVLDFFSKTTQVQSSATVVFSENGAKELLNATSPLDNISSFALQKVLLKNTGFDNDVASIDIRTFCANYYSPHSSSYMPIIKKMSQSSDVSKGEQTGSESSSSSGQNQQTSGSGSKGKMLYDATHTALFKNGVMVGELNTDLTFVFNLLFKPSSESTIKINNVDGINYILSVGKNISKISVSASPTCINLDVSLDLYCRLINSNSTSSDDALLTNKPLNEKLCRATEGKLKSDIESLLNYQSQTTCDIFKIRDKLYRFNYKYYPLYKDCYFEKLVPSISVNVSGQK